MGGKVENTMPSAAHRLGGRHNKSKHYEIFPMSFKCKKHNGIAQHINIDSKFATVLTEILVIVAT